MIAMDKLMKEKMKSVEMGLIMIVMEQLTVQVVEFKSDVEKCDDENNPDHKWDAILGVVSSRVQQENFLPKLDRAI